MATEKVTKFDDIRELKYAENCLYAWPYNYNDEVNWNALRESGWRYDNLQDFYVFHPILRLLNYEVYYENSYDSDADSDPEANDEYEQEKERLLGLAAQLETWSFETVVCSYIFYDLTTEIKNSGSISFLTWNFVMANLASPLIGPELLAVIKRNGFFELSWEKAIKGTVYFFRETLKAPRFFEKPDAQSILLRILECIQVEPQIAQELITETLKTEDFSFILTFLENYNFSKVSPASQQEFMKAPHLGVVPISLVKKSLKIPESKLDSSIPEFLFEKIVNTIKLSWSLFLAFFLILWSRGFLSRRASSKFALRGGGAMAAFVTSVEKNSIAPQSSEQAELINKKQLASSESGQSRSFSVLRKAVKPTLIKI
jgi:hypothetical protein